MITDTEFQNRRDIMRMAPWLDLPMLRKELIISLQKQLDGNGSGHFLVGFVTEYREDVQAFCDGKRDRIPKSADAWVFVQRVIVRIFPTSVVDAGLSAAVRLICTHIMQLETWRRHDRGGEVEETPGETPHRTNPNLEVEVEEDEDYDEYDDEDVEF